MGNGELSILYEDNHLLVVNKPPGLPTMGVAEGERSLVTVAKHYIKQRYQKPGNVYLGIMSRLDTDTSGVVLLARTSKAAARLTEQFRTREVQKTYWAIVAGEVQPPAAELVDWLKKNDARQRVEIVPPGTTGAKEARLSYRLLRAVPRGSWLQVELHTGRKHQIRVQLAARGYPVLGERKYAQAPAFRQGLALHARTLVVRHPVRGDRLEFTAPTPAGWPPHDEGNSVA